MKRILILVFFPLHLFGDIIPIEDVSKIKLLKGCDGNELRVFRIAVENHTAIRLIPTDAKQRNYHARIQIDPQLFEFFSISSNDDAEKLAQDSAAMEKLLDWYYLEIQNEESDAQKDI